MSAIDYPPFQFGRGSAAYVEWETHYRLRDETMSTALGTCLAPEVADLIDLAVAVYLTDRLHRRRPPRAIDDGTHWSRYLRAEVAVRCYERWNRPEVHRLLHDLLRWLTDDEWEITFVAGGPLHPRHSETQPTLFDEPLAAPAAVGLLSGGLDSLLGAAADLETSEGELLLVSTATHPKLGTRQHQLAAALGGLGRRQVRWLGVPMNLTAAGKALVSGPEEPSQRTRAFVFLAIGAAAALSADCDELRAYENGPGALNLALTPSQRGAMNTRAMRPETLTLMARLVSAVTGQRFTISNPNRWKTKAEMCRDAPADLDAAIVACRSCDTALIARRPKDAPCGRCTSCVLRRQALRVAGRTDLDQLDVALMPGDSLRAQVPGQVDPALRLMVGQVAQLSTCLASEDPWTALVHRWPDLASARQASEVESGPFVDLLGRYCAEWRGVRSPVVDRLLAA